MRISDWSSDVCSSDLPFSTYARRVLITLLEKGLQHEAVLIDMAARQHRGTEYLALNPYGRVPTLEEDGLVLYESSAIMQYLEATHPQPALTPPDAKGRALVDMHLRLCDLRSEEHTSELQSLMRNSYAVFCLKKKNTN